MRSAMLILLIPLYALYELGILMLWVAPASRVAEGRIFRSDKTRATGADKASGQPVKPVQAEASQARSAEPTEDEETEQPPADGESDGP